MFHNEFDLADQVTSSIKDVNLMQERTNLEGRNYIEGIYKTSLAIKPEWSPNKISEEDSVGHIVFKIKNISDKRLIIYGYKMFRVDKKGSKDVYYFSSICDAKDFRKWVSDPHIKIILHKNDEHVFHWDDVNIMETYGINGIGKWLTEVQIAYIEEGSKDLFYSTGKTEIEFY